MSRDQKKSRQRFACWSSRGFLAVCDLHSVKAVLLVILNKVLRSLSTICSRDLKKVELHLKDWLSRECAKHRKFPALRGRATRHVACMLRMCCA